jgi:organic hydroperoxide reductase OsmC/OhrA
MSVMKEIQLPVSIRWRGGRLTRAEARNKEALELATPPEFRGGLTGYWSPEDLLIVATSSCFMLTLAAVAERRKAPLLDATVSATGHMSPRDDGCFGFTVIEIDALIETIPGAEEAVRRAAAIAEHRCLIAQALDVPVQVAVSVTTVAPSPEVTR